MSDKISKENSANSTDSPNSPARPVGAIESRRAEVNLAAYAIPEDETLKTGFDRDYNIGYSRVVKLLRLTLPIIALLLLALVLIWPFMTSKKTRIIQEVNQGTALETTDIRYYDIDEDDQPFTLTSSSARQSQDEEGVTYFSDPYADILLNDGSWLAVLADAGRYAEEQSLLRLHHNVRIFQDDGHEIATQDAYIDTDSKVSWGDSPVEAISPLGVMEASGFRVLQEGGIIIFTGPAKFTLYADGIAAAQGENNNAAAQGENNNAAAQGENNNTAVTNEGN